MPHTNRQLAAAVLKCDESELLGFRQLESCVSVIAPNGMKILISAERLRRAADELDTLAASARQALDQTERNAEKKQLHRGGAPLLKPLATRRHQTDLHGGAGKMKP